jgi:hypothetical protein
VRRRLHFRRALDGHFDRSVVVRRNVYGLTVQNCIRDCGYHELALPCARRSGDDGQAFAANARRGPLLRVIRGQGAAVGHWPGAT